MASPIPILTLPDIKIIKPLQFFHSPHSLTSPRPEAEDKNTKLKNKKQPKSLKPNFMKFYKPTSKINTNLRPKEQFSHLPDVKFESFKWSNNTTLQPEIFNLPKINKSALESSYLARNKNERSASHNRDYLNNGFERIDEVADYSPKPLRKFKKVESPWKFQVASFITRKIQIYSFIHQKTLTP